MLDSVRQQSAARYELIVVDGKSTDQTAEVLAREKDIITHLISESDVGVYDAMNKGVSKASGEWSLFIGADDRLADSDVLRDCERLLAASEDSIACGEIRYDDGRTWRHDQKARIIFRNFLHHQATFYRTQLLRENPFDIKYRIQADYHLNLQLVTRKHAVRSIPRRIAICGAHGLSDSGRWANYREEISVRHRHFPRWQCLPWDLASIARYFRKATLKRARNAPE